MFIEMTDSYGDGWNGNVLEFVNVADGTTQSVSLNNGSSGTDEFCLPDGCYTFSAGAAATSTRSVGRSTLATLWWPAAAAASRGTSL